jgi:hypothetical protein
VSVGIPTSGAYSTISGFPFDLNTLCIIRRVAYSFPPIPIMRVCVCVRACARYRYHRKTIRVYTTSYIGYCFQWVFRVGIGVQLYAKPYALSAQLYASTGSGGSGGE